jgi:hypothetical protein
MKTLGCSLIAILVLSAPAFAQDRDLTLFGGIQLPGRVTLSNAPSTGQSGVTQIINDPANVGVFGVRFGTGGVLGNESTFAYAPNFLDSNSKAVILNSNLRIQVPTPVIKPYVTAGLGTFISWGTGASDIGTRFAINYGGGVKFMPGNVGLTADIRGYTLPNVQNQNLNVAEVSLGVVFGF